MRPPDHRLRLGLMAGLLGSALLLGACTRESGVTATPTGPRASASPSRAATPSASPSRSAGPSAGPSAAPASGAPASAPAASSPPPSPAPSTAPPAGQKYVVERGDTLSAIAEKFGVTTQQLIDANKLTNPDLLVVGQELIIPAR